MTFSPLGLGVARGAGSSYPPAFTSTDSGHHGLTVRRGLSTGAYYVSVGLLRYDTSSIPDGATIESAYLEIYTFQRVSANERKLVAEWYDAGETWGADDYTATAAATAHAGTPLSTFPAGSYLNTTPTKTVLTLTGLGSISTTGITGLRLHIDGGSPTGDNSLRIASKDGGGLSWDIRALIRLGASGVATNPWAYITRTPVYHAPRLVITYADPTQSPGNLPGPGASTDPSSPFAQPRAAARLPRRHVPWRFLIGDSTGRPISWLSLAARRRTLSYRLNLPARVSFEVPSSDPSVSGVHLDGFPILEPQMRTLQAWRLELEDDGTPVWRLRFSGWVWQVEDAGDADTAITRVTAFDPLQVLLLRYTGSALAGDPMTEFHADGASIVRQLVDWTNATVGPTGVTTDGGVFERTPQRSVRYERKSIGQAIVELASAFNGFDVWLEPVQRYDDFGIPIYDGVLCRLHCYARKGLLQEQMIYGWGIAPHNVKEARRLIDGQTRATRVIGLGAGGIVSIAETQAPLVLEALESYGDVSNQAFLDALVAEELSFRRRARELVTMIPQPGRSPEPFTHLNVGDLFKVYAGQKLRGGFQGVQRCYGFDLSVSDEGLEQMTAIICSPEES